MSPAPAIQTPGKCSPEHLSAPIPGARACLCGCGKTFRPTRRWHVFYSTDCRKRQDAIKRRSEAPADIRATLARIEECVKLTMDQVRLLADLRLDQRIKDLERHLSDNDARSPR